MKTRTRDLNYLTRTGGRESWMSSVVATIAQWIPGGQICTSCSCYNIANWTQAAGCSSGLSVVKIVGKMLPLILGLRSLVISFKCEVQMVNPGVGLKSGIIPHYTQASTLHFSSSIIVIFLRVWARFLPTGLH